MNDERVFGDEVPTAPKQRVHWQLDEDVYVCRICRTDFNFLIRQHHCRRCGRIYCADCTSLKCLIPPDELAIPPIGSFHLENLNPCEPQRVCRPCSHFLLPIQDDLQQTVAQAAQSVDVDPVSMNRYLNMPLNFDMVEEIRKATYTVLNFTEEDSLEAVGAETPAEIIARAAGLAFITVAKAGFLFSSSVGSGLVIGRTPSGEWSAPSAIMCVGAGWGLQLGGEVTDMMVILESRDEVDAFASTAQLSLGTAMGMAAGSMGRSAKAGIHTGERANSVAAIFTYSKSRGLYLGMSVDAAFMMSRPDLNRNFYGKDVNEQILLNGQ